MRVLASGTWALRLLLIAALCAGLAGCARLAPPGPGPTEPGLQVANPETGRYTTSDGLELPLRVWAPNPRQPDAVLLALHGFNDYSHAWSGPAPAWAALGIAVYAYDQRGFGGAPARGLWPGVEALAEDLRTAAELLRRRHPGVPLYLLGESMGGAVVLTAAAEPVPLPVDGLILAAPAVWARETQPWYQRAALWLGRNFFPWVRPSGDGFEIRPSDNREALIALGRDPLVIKETRVDAVAGLVDLMDAALEAAPRVDLPLLFLYGANDELVPKEPTLKAWRDLPGGSGQSLAYYRDGWHLLFRDLQGSLVASDVAAWVFDPATPLPSGADRAAERRLAADTAAEADDAPAADAEEPLQ